jgi:hypothetical protein
MSGLAIYFDLVGVRASNKVGDPTMVWKSAYLYRSFLGEFDG